MTPDGRGRQSLFRPMILKPPKSRGSVTATFRRHTSHVPMCHVAIVGCRRPHRAPQSAHTQAGYAGMSFQGSSVMARQFLDSRLQPADPFLLIA
jgi:hypothetical protein